jgi:multidrug efflux system outer membrane protein
MNVSARLAKAGHKQCLLAIALACGFLVVVSGCQIPKLRQAELGLGLPVSYNGVASQESSAQLRVEEFYNDPNLTGLICQAVANNRELQSLNQEVQIARNEILARRGAYLPFVGFRGSAGFDKPSRFTPLGAAEDQLEYFPGRHFPDPLPNFLAGLNIFWQLDIWRELRNARDAAIQRYLSTVDRRNYFLTRLVADIAENYYSLIALDKRIENLNRIIKFQQQSYEIAQEKFKAGTGTELAVRRFLAEFRKNQSEKLIVGQEIIETENRINTLASRFPQAVERYPAAFFDLNIHALSVGVPAQLLQYRPDIRQAERELAAAGLDIKVARAHFFPRLDLSAAIGYQAFNPKYLLMGPEALVASLAGDLTAPLINKAAIRADFMNANAKQLQSLYNYQRVVINAFTEVVNRLSMVENYRRSITLKQQQLTALETSVELATQLFQASRVEYIEVLFAQRDLLDARRVLIDTKRQQLSAIVNTYQALGGGYLLSCPPPEQPLPAADQLPPPREMKKAPEPLKKMEVPLPPPMPGAIQVPAIPGEKIAP